MMNSVTSRLSNGGQSFMPNQRTYQVEANWIEPHLKGTDTSLALSGFGRNLNSMMIDYAQQQTVGASATFSHPLGKNLAANLGFTGDNTILRNAGTALQQEQAASYLSGRIMQTGLASDPVTASQMAGAVRASQLQGGLYASINPSVQYDTRDNVMDPNKGSYVKVTGTPSLGITAGSFLRGGVNASHYVPVTKDSSLAFNMQGGASMGSLPAFAQYRLGGWNGLRGYRSFTDLGSGTSMLMATAEYRFKLPFVPKGDPKSLKGKVVNTINNHVKGTVFSDFGAVGGDPLVNNLYQRSMMGASVGVGLRLNVPMLGVIRLDYGFPLINSALGGMKPRFTVGFGNKF
jgi:outer membrane protein assembly factor BamA